MKRWLPKLFKLAVFAAIFVVIWKVMGEQKYGKAREKLGSTIDFIRAQGANELGYAGSRASGDVGRLAEMLRSDPSRDVKWSAATAIGRIAKDYGAAPPDAAAAYRALTDAAEHGPDAPVREAAAEAAAILRELDPSLGAGEAPAGPEPGPGGGPSYVPPSGQVAEPAPYPARR